MTEHWIAMAVGLPPLQRVNICLLTWLMKEAFKLMTFKQLVVVVE